MRQILPSLFLIINLYKLCIYLLKYTFLLKKIKKRVKRAVELEPCYKPDLML